MHRKLATLFLTFFLFLAVFAYLTPAGHSIDWSPDMRFTWKSGTDQSPHMVETNDGKKWVVWSSDRTGNAEIFYKIYDNTSVHPWSSDIQLTTNSSTDVEPAIMQAQDGAIWVVWSSNRTGRGDLYYKTYSGAAWSNDKPLILDPSYDGNPDIMQLQNGTIWVVWYSDRDDTEIYRAASSDNGQTWTQQRLTYNIDESDIDPAVMQTASGVIWLVWAKEYDIYYKTHSGGTSWSIERSVTTDPGHDVRPSVMQAKDGKVWVAWDTDRNSLYEDIYYNVNTGGTTWLGDTQLTTDPSDDIDPSIMQVSDGTIWVTWWSTRLNSLDLYYKINSLAPAKDISVFSVEATPTIVAKGRTVSIEVVTQNKGTSTQTFDVSCYAGAILVGTKTVSLVSGQLNASTFQWNTLSVPLGYYVVRAEAPLTGDSYLDDNTYIDGTVMVGTRDVAILSVTSSQTTVHRGYTTLYIDVVVQNQGNFTETTTVIAYYNKTAIQSIMLQNFAPNTQTTVTFTWMPMPSYGPYNISAKVSHVPDELDVADNSLADGNIFVTIPGDINGDRSVNILDAGAVSNHWYPGPPVGPSGYDPNADVNCDGKVSIVDLAVINGNWLRSW